jgi:nickel-type superoxide dismutase maturation protease
MNEKVGRIAPVVIRSAVIAAVAGLAFRIARRFRRFAISGRSMLPTLSPGDWVLVDERAYQHGALPRRGHVVVAADPREPARHLVKRVAAVDLHGQVRLEGDNADESTDSREFGAVPVSNVKGRVRWRYWPMGRAGSVI